MERASPSPAIEAETKSSRHSFKTDTNATTSSFHPDSIFDRVERNMCGLSLQRWSCDLGDEWADYITLEPDGSFRFIHCKHGKESGGASPFQDVIGQALKNLGRAKVSHAEFLKKVSDLGKNPLWGQSGIKRHKGTANFASDVQACLENPDRSCEVILVVTMLSKAKFDLQAKKGTLEPHFIQLIWFLGAFVHSCREMGARPKIVCLP